MELESVRRFLEKDRSENASTIDAMPSSVFDTIIMQGLNVDLIEPGRVVCSFKVPPRLLNSGNSLHGGATASLVDVMGSAAILAHGSPVSGVSVEISVSYLAPAYADEEIEVEAKTLRVGKSVAFVTVELRNKKTRKIIAQGRHTKYLLVSSKL